jgi:hypothetical protein
MDQLHLGQRILLPSTTYTTSWVATGCVFLIPHQQYLSYYWILPRKFLPATTPTNSKIAPATLHKPPLSHITRSLTQSPYKGLRHNHLVPRRQAHMRNRCYPCTCHVNTLDRMSDLERGPGKINATANFVCLIVASFDLFRKGLPSLLSCPHHERRRRFPESYRAC